MTDAREYLTKTARLQELYFPYRRPMSSSVSLRRTIFQLTKRASMSFYDASVPAYLQILSSLSGLLAKAEAHCKAKNISPTCCSARACSRTCCR